MAAKNHRSAGALTLNERIVVPWRSLGWLLAAALATVHVWMLYRFAVDFPFQDDFTQVLAVPGAVAHRAALLDKIAYLFSSSVEHRIATLRVIALVQGTLLGGLNFRGLIYFGNALAAAAGLLLLLQAPASQRAWLAPLITALLFSPTNFVAQYWTTAALAHFGVIAYALGAHCCLARGGLARSASGLLLGLAAAFTLANGLMVFPVGTVMLWASGRIRAASIWMLLTIVLFGLYFIGYESTGGESRFDALEHPFRLAVAYLCALGSMGGELMYAVGLGIVMVIAWIWLVATRATRFISPVLLAWIGFLFLSIAAITVGRSPLGADAVLSSRYRPYSEIAVLITLIAILGRLEQRMRDWLLALSFALVGVWFWTSWQTNLPGIADLALRQRNSLDHYAVNGHGIYGEFPPQYFGDLVLNDVRQGGYFEPVKQSMPPRDLIKDVQPLHSTQGSRLVIGPLSFDTEAISVHGLLEGNQENVTLWLVDGATQYRAPLRTERMFKSLADNDWTLFWKTLRLHGVAPGRYRIGYAAGHDAAAVVWADAWADIQ